MKTVLHIDASPRGGQSDTHRFGSHSRRLTARFVRRWTQARPGDLVLYRDVGLTPPAMVTYDWMHAAFTPEDARAPWMTAMLAESDRLVDELIAADVIVIGVPMYNFGPPAQLKAWIDNVVRIGRTFGFDRARDPYTWPLLTEKPRDLVVIASRGDVGYEPGQPYADRNHVEPQVFTAMSYLGLDRQHAIAVEGDEWADERLAQSLARAEAAVDRLVEGIGRG